jgi:hypothetical protein
MHSGLEIRRLVGREIAHRRGGFVLGALSVAVAVGIVTAAITLLAGYDLRSEAIRARSRSELARRLEALDADVRAAMDALGFNITIIPGGQQLSDWYADDYAAHTMPEACAETLAGSDLLTIERLVPRLRQKIRWPETGWTVIVVGVGGGAGEERVPEGQVVLGHEIHRGRDLEAGDSVQLMGRRFTVHACRPEQGTKDDITAWLTLRESQELLGKEGLVNEIAALGCRAAWRDVPAIREEIRRVVTDAQVVEHSSSTLARLRAREATERAGREALRAEEEGRARFRRESLRLGRALVAVVVPACVVWLAAITTANVRERRPEIGVLTALGCPGRGVQGLFVARSLLVGAAGLAAGYPAGRLLARAAIRGAGDPRVPLTLLDAAAAGSALALGLVMAGLAAGLAAAMAARESPARILAGQ